MGAKTLKQFLEDAKKSDTYWIEQAKLQFSMTLERERRKAGLSYAELAKRLGTSAAYISKVFRGDTNLTIESMVKLARAVGCNFHFEIADQANELTWIEKVSSVGQPLTEAKETYLFDIARKLVVADTNQKRILYSNVTSNLNSSAIKYVRKLVSGNNVAEDAYV